MATTYTWSILQMDAYPEAYGETNVVFNIHWSLTGEEAGFTSSIYGSQGLSIAPDATFTPYADLTEDQVIEWLMEAMGADQVIACKQSVSQQINNQIVPPVVTPPLPWSA